MYINVEICSPCRISYRGNPWRHQLPISTDPSSSAMSNLNSADIATVSNPDENTDVFWNNSYASISACTTLISLVASNSKLDPEDLRSIAGEAHFLRAFSY